MGSHHLLIHDMMMIFFRLSIHALRQNGFSLILIQDNVKFTMETEVNKVIPFLDVLIDKRNNILNTATYHKSTFWIYFLILTVSLLVFTK